MNEYDDEFLFFENRKRERDSLLFDLPRFREIRPIPHHFLRQIHLLGRVTLGRIQRFAEHVADLVSVHHAGPSRPRIVHRSVEREREKKGGKGKVKSIYYIVEYFDRSPSPPSSFFVVPFLNI